MVDFRGRRVGVLAPSLNKKSGKRDFLQKKLVWTFVMIFPSKSNTSIRPFFNAVDFRVRKNFKHAPRKNCIKKSSSINPRKNAQNNS